MAVGRMSSRKRAREKRLVTQKCILVVLVYTMCITSLGRCLVHLKLLLADSHDYLDIYLYNCLAITLAVRGMIFQAGCQTKEGKANKLAGF